MAIVIPESAFSSEDITSGEKKSLRILQNGLDDSSLLWFQPQLAETRRPDIIAYIPTLGLVLYEVKDWSITNIIEANPDVWTVNFGSRQRKLKAPHKQARDYFFNLSEMLEKKSLVSQEGNNQGKVKIPIGTGVIFTNIKRSDFIKKSLEKVIETDRCLFKDDLEKIQEDEEPRKTRAKIKKHFNPWWAHDELSKSELDDLRGCLYPEITSIQKDKGGEKKDIILDAYQEQVARKIDSGHSIVRGVAGSGKSLVLCSKAILIAEEHPDWRVLITCYNVALASQLRYYINSFRKREGVSLKNIEIVTFHKLCFGLGRKHGVQLSKINQQGVISSAQFASLSEDKQEAELDEMESSLLGQDLQRICSTKKIDKYNAILVDESQDFHPSWLTGLTLLLDGESNFLLLAEDPNQKIYPREFSYKKSGVKVQGRKDHKLPIGYRSTREIVVPASKLVKDFSKEDKFYKEYLEERGDIQLREDELPRGKSPTIKVVGHYLDICQNIADDISYKLQKGYKYSDFGIIYLFRANVNRQPSQQKLSFEDRPINYVDGIREKLSENQIPHFWLSENRSAKGSYDQFKEEVTITTIFSAKGLEFQIVYLVGLELYPWAKRNKRENASMLYVAMTRAKEELHMFSTQNTEYVKELQASIDETRRY